jgi:prepilin-type N-terminal cleavage/methylation domain-containing protein
MPAIRHQKGFTLVEIVITVVITAIMSALVIQAIGSNIQRSAAPLQYVRSNLSIQQVMDNIAADYKQLFITDTSPMVTFQNRIAANTTSDGPHPYWTPYNAFSASINAIQFTSSASCDAAYSACFDEVSCNSNCSNYLVIITQTNNGQNLSAIFAE